LIAILLRYLTSRSNVIVKIVTWKIKINRRAKLYTKIDED